MARKPLFVPVEDKRISVRAKNAHEFESSVWDRLDADTRRLMNKLKDGKGGK